MKISCKDKFELIKYQIKDEVEKLKDKYGVAPVFTIIQVAGDDASDRYVKGKIADCKFVGIKPLHYKFKEDISENELIGEIVREQKHCDAIIVQLPLPKHINIENVLKYIDPKKDVDGLTKNSMFEPCTPLGVISILEDYIDIEGKNAVVLGRSNLVGLPLANMLQKRDATVTLCHSKTDISSRANYLKNADIVVSAIGKYKPELLIDINPKAIIVDVGINRGDEGKLVGDLPNDYRWNKTPVPGGVGLMTRAMLLKNILNAYKLKNSYE